MTIDKMVKSIKILIAAGTSNNEKFLKKLKLRNALMVRTSKIKALILVCEKTLSTIYLSK
jgi:hypothetical protein